MEYIQLDNFNGNLSIVCEDDESGEPLIFDDLKEAESTLKENCQDGQVIPLDINIVEKLSTMEYLIKKMYESHKNGTFNIVHIGDLVCKILNINATFYSSGKIEEK